MSGSSYLFRVLPLPFDGFGSKQHEQRFDALNA